LTWVEYDFRLAGLPLKQRVPRRLEPPSFPGRPAPVSVQAVPAEAGTARGAVTVQLRDHSQKDGDRLPLKWSQEGGKGAEAGEAEVALPAKGLPDWADRLPVLVPAGETRKTQVAAPGPPADASAVRVRAVGFTDGTSWVP